jgi:hypothetical protein
LLGLRGQVRPGARVSLSLLSVVCCQVTVRLQRLRVRIPSGAWMFVCCECCVLSRGHCVGLIARPEEFYRMSCVWVWSWIVDNRAWPTRGCRAIKNLVYLLLHISYYVVINLFRTHSCDRSVAFSLLTLSCVSFIARSSSTLFATVPKPLSYVLRPSTGP